MLLRALTTQGGHQGLTSGSDAILVPSGILGGVNISADGSNAATVIVRKGAPGNPGEVIFHQVTISPIFIIGPIQAAQECTISVSGTGGLAQFFEWVP